MAVGDFPVFKEEEGGHGLDLEVFRERGLFVDVQFDKLHLTFEFVA